MTLTDIENEITNMTKQIEAKKVDLIQMAGALEAFHYIKAKMEKGEDGKEAEKRPDQEAS